MTSDAIALVIIVPYCLTGVWVNREAFNRKFVSECEGMGAAKELVYAFFVAFILIWPLVLWWDRHPDSSETENGKGTE